MHVTQQFYQSQIICENYSSISSYKIITRTFHFTLTQSHQILFFLQQMTTIDNRSFIISDSPYPRYHSISLTSKNSPEKILQKQRHIKTQFEECEFLNSVSKNYLYFHEQTKKVPHDQKKLSFPYNPLNLCYFQNKFGGKKDPTQRKKLNFNTNRSIRNYLDLKLHTEPTQSQLSESEKQICIGKKISERKKKAQQPLIKEKIFQSITKGSTRIIGNDEKQAKIGKFPLVLKIKSKKAYFLSRFKNKASKDEQMNEANTICMKKDLQQDVNPFEIKFRSKTQDNINLMNLMRSQSRRGSHMKKDKQIANTIKEEKVDPWDYQNPFMESSLKFDERF